MDGSGEGRAALTLGVLVAMICGGCGAPGPCDGVTCSGAGTCHEAAWAAGAYCQCRSGYHPTGDGLSCAPNDPHDPCYGVACNHGDCVAWGAIPLCVCFPGWAPDPSAQYCMPVEPSGSDADADVGAEDAREAEMYTWWVDEWVHEQVPAKLDILLLVDNSGSMSEEQAALTRYFPELITELVAPPDADGDTRPDHGAVEDLNLGVITPDMGTMDYRVTTCRNAAVGDNGCLRSAPSRAVAGCDTTYPAFLSRNPANAATYTADRIAHDFACIATLGTSGCGFEQPFKAMRTALVDNVRRHACNEGFLRPDSLLAPIFVTDEDDCSARVDHPEMFDPDRDDLGHLNLRCFLHSEFVESVAGYVAAFRGLRPADDQDRLSLGMIVGVPPDTPICTGDGDGLEGCLGLPDMLEMVDPATPTQLVPSCVTSMGFAFPPRRFVQLAQALGDQAYVGSICQADWHELLRAIAARLTENLSDHICLDEGVPFDGITCTSGCFLVETLDDTRPCAADPTCWQDWCPPGEVEHVNRLMPCRDPATGAECVPLKRDLGLTDASGSPRRQCVVRQVSRDVSAFRCGGPLGDGWYYVPPAWSERSCPELVFAHTSLSPLLESRSAAVLRCPR